MSPRKLRRGYAGQQVRCRICPDTVPITKAREDVQLTARTYSSSGTLTDVSLLKRLGTFVCDRCVMLIELGLDPLAPQNRIEAPQSAQEAML